MNDININDLTLDHNLFPLHPSIKSMINSLLDENGLSSLYPDRYKWRLKRVDISSGYQERCLLAKRLYHNKDEYISLTLEIDVAQNHKSFDIRMKYIGIGKSKSQLFRSSSMIQVDEALEAIKKFRMENEDV